MRKKIVQTAALLLALTLAAACGGTDDPAANGTAPTATPAPEARAAPTSTPPPPTRPRRLDPELTRTAETSRAAAAVPTPGAKA